MTSGESAAHSVSFAQNHKGDQVRSFSVRTKTYKDMPQVLAIEERCFNDPWSAEDFSRVERMTGSMFFVADNGVSVCGYLLLERSESHFSICNMAVAEWARRNKVGSNLIDSLKRFTVTYGHSFAEALVPDDMVAGHHFLKSQGFRAISVEREFFDGKDGYLFRWFNSER